MLAGATTAIPLRSAEGARDDRTAVTSLAGSTGVVGVGEGEAIATEPERLRRKLDAAERELELFRRARALESDLLRDELEAAGATGEEENGVRSLLEDFPIVLSAGEATWILESLRSDDWMVYSPNYEEALMLFFGPERILEVLSSDDVESMRFQFGDRQWWPQGW